MLAAVGAEGPNIWGMLACATAYAAAIFAAVDGIADFLLNRRTADPGALHALRLKTVGKLGASGVTVTTAGVVLLLDSNVIAFLVLTVVLIGILLWVFYIYREGGRTRPPAGTRG